MDIVDIGAAVALVKSIPGSAAQRAETAAQRAETAADSVSSASVSETLAYLNISTGA